MNLRDRGWRTSSIKLRCCRIALARKMPPLLLASALYVPLSAAADPIVEPNPGGSTVFVNTYTASFSYVDTSATQRQDDYSTTLDGYLNGSEVFSGTIFAPYSDPAVQNEIAQIDNILSGEGANFGDPILDSASTSLESSVTGSNPNYTCSSYESSFGSVATNYFIGPPSPSGATVTLATSQSPPVYGTGNSPPIAVGDCQSELFYPNAGQTVYVDIDEFDFSIPETLITTNTFLTDATYEIDGTTATQPVPEPLTLAVFVGGMLGLAATRRRKKWAS